jgi:hypothetical protein
MLDNLVRQKGTVCKSSKKSERAYKPDSPSQFHNPFTSRKLSRRLEGQALLPGCRVERVVYLLYCCPKRTADSTGITNW